MAKLEPAADPSMEDILASIRRIIADGDDSRRTPPPPHLAVVERAPVAVRAASKETPAAPVEAPPLAAIASAVVRADRAEAAPVRKAPDAKVEIPKPPQAAAAATAAVAAVILEPDADEPETADAPISISAPTIADDPPEPLAVDMIQPAPAMPTAVAAAMAAPAAARPEGFGGQPAPEAPRPEQAAPPEQPIDAGLMSAQTDAAVHTAFDHLAGIMLSRESRTLEDIVKDMMRPMLRDWLDDNLPPLVERLVREEIQRVSRGRR